MCVRFAVCLLFVVASSSTLNAQITFSDVTAARSLDSYRAFAGDLHSPGGIFADLNNDDYPDLYVVSSDGNSGYNRLYLNVDDNNGGRTFSLQPNALGAVNDTNTNGSDPFNINGENGFRGVTGAIAGDYDNDGDLDIYVTNMGLPNRLYQNQLANTGTLSFVDVTNTAGVSGINQIVRADNSNQPNGAAFNGSNDSLTATWFDPDRDGDLDLYVGNHRDFSEPFPFIGSPDTFYINNGDGTFTDSTAQFSLGGHEDENGNAGNYADTNAVVAGDLNNDGWVDLLVTNKSGDNSSGNRNVDQFYINRGADASGNWLGYESQTYSQNLQALFTDNLITRSAMGVYLCDVDGDGDLDIYMSDNPESVVSRVDGSSDLFINQFVPSGTLSFTHGLVDTGLSWGVQIQDFDNDGDVEIHTTNDVSVHSGYSALLQFPDNNIPLRTRTNADANNQLFIGGGGSNNSIPNGDMVANVVDIAIAAGAGNFEGNGRGNLAADYNRDGRLDLFVINLNNDPREGSLLNDPSVLLENTSNNSNGFLSVKLIGAPGDPNENGFATSRDAIGSRVRVLADVDGDGDEELLIRDVFSSAGNSSGTSSRYLSFGLGEASEVDLEVVWADGRSFDLGTVSGDRFMKVSQVRGDVNQDGFADSADVIPFFMIAFGGFEYQIEGDMNFDGFVDSADTILFFMELF